MIDLQALHARIDDSGMTITAISRKIGIKRETMYSRLNGKTDFKAAEIQRLADVLDLSRKDRDTIFFA